MRGWWAGGCIVLVRCCGHLNAFRAAPYRSRSVLLLAVCLLLCLRMAAAPGSADIVGRADRCRGASSGGHHPEIPGERRLGG